MVSLFLREDLQIRGSQSTPWGRGNVYIMENEIIDFYNLYLRSVFFFFNIVVVKIGKDVGPPKMGCDGLAYVSGEHWSL